MERPQTDQYFLPEIIEYKLIKVINLSMEHHKMFRKLTTFKIYKRKSPYHFLLNQNKTIRVRMDNLFSIYLQLFKGTYVVMLMC